MNRSRLVFLLISGILVLTILSGTLLGAPTRDGEGEDSLYKYLSVFTEVLRLVRQAYVDETDLDLLMNGALDGTPDALDPFSMYVPEDAVPDYLVARQVGESRSGLRVAKERGVAYVVAVQEKGPAAVLGLQQGDIVSRLDGESTRELPLWRIEKALTAAPGTKVKLEVLRAGETENFTLELAEFQPPVAYVETYQSVPRLRVASFTKEAPAVVGKLMGSVQGNELLIDLRGVAFGDVERAYEVAKLFAAGDLGFLMKRDQKLETYTGADNQGWRGKTVVLVDRGTQGAAEVFAQILRQRSGAKLVGQPTFGFAGRSKVIELDAGGSIVLTDAFFTGPDGEPVNEGIEPDVLVGDRARSFKELGESLEDLILERALDVLRDQAGAAEKKAA
jgi:carboxyl-terminal processing protease